ncbi:arginine repressor [Vallitaleaceae bacterium 9-2]
MKIKRQTKILQLITEQVIETQDELAELLHQNGFEVTQATISRDIRDLKLTKVSLPDGRQKYVVLQEKTMNLNEKYIRVLQDGYLSMDRAMNLIVIQTLTGMAMAVAAAIDALDFDEIVGSIAGDDTIFCAVRTEDDCISIMEKLNRIIHSA